MILYLQPVFSKGAGSQMMLSQSSAMMSSAHSFSQIDEQARNLLNDNERGKGILIRLLTFSLLFDLEA